MAKPTRQARTTSAPGELGWIDAGDGYALGLEAGKLVARNARGKRLSAVPKPLRDGEVAGQLEALRDWLAEHDRACQTTVEQWMLRSLPVPRAVLEQVWDDPAWRTPLENGRGPLPVRLELLAADRPRPRARGAGAVAGAGGDAARRDRADPRIEEVTRCLPEVQDALVSVLSDLRLSAPELGALEMAQRGFNVIATANLRDKGVSGMSAALKRRFNFETVAPSTDLARETELVRRRARQIVAETGAPLAVDDAVLEVLVTVFRDLRSGAASRAGRSRSRRR